jgi:hypothetical protein
VSIGENGMDENGNAGFFAPATTDFGSKARAAREGTSMSSEGAQDGSRVFFSGAAGLTRHALNDACASVNGEGECVALAQNVYEWEQAGDGSCPPSQLAGCIYLISDGQDHHAVFGASTVNFIGTSASGNDAFFTTADPLAPQETVVQSNIYDARVDGGYPAPAQAGGCQNEACQGPLSASPSFGAPASTTLLGQGNLAPSSASTPSQKTVAKCSRGKKLNRGRCVRKAKARKGKKGNRTRRTRSKRKAR